MNDDTNTILGILSMYSTIQYNDNSHLVTFLVYAKIQDRSRPVAYLLGMRAFKRLNDMYTVLVLTYGVINK